MIGGLCVKVSYLLHNFSQNFGSLVVKRVMTTVSNVFDAVSVDVKIDSRDYTDVTAALTVDPKVIREKLLLSEDKKIIADICECIVVVGPRPDRVLAKLSTRAQVSLEVQNKIKERTTKIDVFCKKHNIRGTQFQAAFPDIIFKNRDKLIKDDVKLQRFVADDILPVVFQFPGSGPILPDSYRNTEHYGQFNVELTKALSQGRLSVNWSIIQKSLEWKINVDGVDDYDDITTPHPQTPVQSSSSSSTQSKPKKTEKKTKDSRG
jgi:hypothetical protein